jgi:hypothetical protein
MQAISEKCPYCDSQISRAKFEEVKAKIRKEELAKLAEREAAIRKELETKHKLKVEEEKKKAAKVATAAAQTRIKELSENVSKLSAKETQLKKELKEQADKELKKQLSEQRQILEANQARELLKQQSEFTREREKLLKRVGDVERQLQKRTANELGDGAEIDLFEVLKESFSEDRIKRVPKGEAGADIHQEVIYKGEGCGLIIFDSKNRQSWQRSFATKLHQDQLAANADHAILSTTVFPTGKKELCIEEGVILVNPGRAVHIVQILRNGLVKMHVRGLSIKEKKEKMNQLYQLITSEQYGLRFAEAGNLTKGILDLDVQEQEAHRKVWNKRGQLAKSLQNVLNEIDTDVSSIVEGPSASWKNFESATQQEPDGVLAE